MHIRIGLENNIENRTLAWALDYPGCFAFGEDEPEALIRLPQALLKYEIWIKDHTTEPWVDFSDLDLRVVERFDTFNTNDRFEKVPDGQGHEIKAWFFDDWRPLSSQEIQQALLVYRWQRDELLAGLTTLDPDILTMQRPGQRWNIEGIAKHIANAELWLLSRLALTELTHIDLLEDIEERLAQMARIVEAILPTLADKVKVVGTDAEFWSYRKLVRRILWHQRDHIDHIKSLVL